MDENNSLSTPIQTIIIPTWNQKRMLLEAIDSCLKQSQKSIEVIVFDDGSTDGTDELMKTVTDERVHYFRSEKNVGGGRRFGLDRARGKYITFLDHDDYYTDYDFFAKAVKILDEHENDEVPIAFLGASSVLLNEISRKSIVCDVGNSGRVRGLDFLIDPHKYPKPNSVFPTVFRADILRKIDFDTYSMGDIFLYMLSALHGDVWYLPDVIGVWRRHGANELSGVKNNPEYDKRIPAAKIKGTRTWLFIRDNLYKHYSKLKVDLWFAERMAMIFWGQALHHKGLSGLKKRLKSEADIFKAAGFMPAFWVMFPLRRIYTIVRGSLSEITPLRAVYRFFKYRLRGKPYPDFPGY